MTDPAFWRDLKGQFQQLGAHFGDTLTAIWMSNRHPSGDHWILTRSALSSEPEREKELFTALAERAVVTLFQTGEKSWQRWLDHLRENSSHFKNGGTSEVHRDGISVEEYTWGIIERPCQASAECCFKLETAAMAARLCNEPPETSSAPAVMVGDPSPTGQRPTRPEIAKRALIRRSVVVPILKNKRWTRGKWATMSGVGKNSVYEYLTGKRNLTHQNRKAMAEAIGLKPEELPD